MDPRITHSKGAFERVMFATITAVNTTQGTVSIIFNDQWGFRDNVAIPVIAMSANAWMRFIPQVNDIVIVGIRGDDSAVILGWHPYAYAARTSAFKKDDLNAAAAGDEGKEHMQELKGGEIDIRAAGGGYLRFNSLGDVLLMSLTGRINMYGPQGQTEHVQNAFKVTDGKSWFRFGSIFRSFPLVSERELACTGMGVPAKIPTPLKERDTKIFDPQGNLLVQESLGTVVDDLGIIELSGTSG